VRGFRSDKTARTGAQRARRGRVPASSDARLVPPSAQGNQGEGDLQPGGGHTAREHATLPQRGKHTGPLKCTRNASHCAAATLTKSFVFQILQLQMNDYKYHYLFTTFVS
jgi:hypothetical protein